jgi:ABC-type transport system involved in cytochrome bd biosynthesis fused ATPase/permease subunit
VYKDVCLQFHKNLWKNINLRINKGDRIALSGDSNSFKDIFFYLLENSIFDSEEIKGNIIINGKVET